MNRIEFSIIGWTIPSQNVRENKRSWKDNWKEKKELLFKIRNAINTKPDEFPLATGPRWLYIVSFRKRLLDHANLVGGAKGLVDALVQSKLLVDDNPSMMFAEYHQFIAKDGENPVHTFISIGDGLEIPDLF